MATRRGKSKPKKKKNGGNAGGGGGASGGGAGSGGCGACPACRRKLLLAAQDLPAVDGKQPSPESLTHGQHHHPHCDQHQSQKAKPEIQFNRWRLQDQDQNETPQPATLVIDLDLLFFFCIFAIFSLYLPNPFLLVLHTVSPHLQNPFLPVLHAASRGASAAHSSCMNALDYYTELIGWLLSHVSFKESDMFLLQSVATCCALSWLLHRAWQVLWKPLPELINILGYEVPDAPEVSLAGIKADSITLHWARPSPDKPVLKYLIQVNGVNVGESSRQETAITVTGLKPSHFYNVRVIGVASSNFQAGSEVIRLRTYNKDGRPELGNGRILANFSIADLHNGTLADSSDDSVVVRGHGIGIETAAGAEGTQISARDAGTSQTGQRRNTGGRKHSPSTASEHPMPVPTILDDGEETMQQLTERFEAIRRDTEDVQAQIGKDAEEFKVQVVDLTKERDEKRMTLKEKEEASEKLKKEAHYAERANRQAQNQKSQLERRLRDKQAERMRMQDDIARWKRETQEMKDESEAWRVEKEKIKRDTEIKTKELREDLRKRQDACNAMEEEIRIKGLQIKQLEKERQKLPGVEDDEESKARDAEERQRDLEWEIKERDWLARINAQTITYRNLESDLQKAQAYHAQLLARQASNPLMYHGNSSGVDFGDAQGRIKARRPRQRKSRTNTISSPVTAYPIVDSAFPTASAYNNMNVVAAPSFAPGPYFDMSANTGMTQLSETSGMSEADIRALTAGAPLSPTATSLLPSNIFADDEPPSPRGPLGQMRRPSGFGTTGPSVFENEQQSPESSSRSPSLMSSPRTSSYNLAMHPSMRESGNDSDRRSLHSPGADFGVIGSPSTSNAQPGPARRFGDLFSFQRQRGKLVNDDGPALGSLKPGQSHSFPRQTDEIEPQSFRNRRTSFSSGWGGLPFLTRSGAGGEVAEGNGPAPARNAARRRRGFNMFGNSIDNTTNVYFERDPGSPRPASIASSDFPRPSTDSAPFGWPAADGGIANRNSPLATNWSLNMATHPWSRNPSRRPSIHYGSTSALSTGIAADDDEFLPQSSPPPVGVIGTRPQSSKSAIPKLNPNAPTFKAMFGRKNDKPEKTRSKAKSSSDSTQEYPSVDDGSPTDSRKSRDNRSIHTQAESVTESHDSLDQSVSNTTSDIMTPSTKDGKETSFQKLLRKGSSSKFSISSFRGKESSLFGKKGDSIKSDRNASGDRSSNFGDMEEAGEDHMLGRSFDSVTSSPQIGTPGTPKEGRMSVNWGRFSIKKGKSGRTSMDAGEREKERASETEGTEDEEKM